MRLGRVILLLAVLGAAGVGGWYAFVRQPATEQAQTGRGRGRRAANGDPIPVLTATAGRADVPVYLDALGTVQAFNTVSIKPMIDGPLVAVLFKEGQDVHAGDVLARIDPRPYQAALDQVAAKKAQDEANLANARVDLARYQKLVATAYTSAQTSDTQRATVAQDEAIVKQDQAQIDTARTNLSYTTIVSPLDGRTGIRQVDSGNIVHAADTTPLTVITQLQPVSVVFNLPQQTLGAVARALSQGAPEVLALPQVVADEGRAVLDRGMVAVLDNTVDQATGTIKLKATFPNAALALWPGGFVNTRLLIDTERDVVTVPPAAVQRGPAGAFVYVLNANATVTRRAVQVGHEDEAVSVVASGLAPGERVVTDGAARLTDGAKVTAQEPDGAPSAQDAAPRRTPGQRRQRAAAAP